MLLNGNRETNKYFYAFGISFVLWIGLIHQSFYSAVEIWIGNEIYNHCLIVIPASIYLIYDRRHTIDWSQIQMSWLAVFFFFGELLFYTLGTAAGIQLFQHVAVFSMLPTLVWIFIGNKLAWQLRFPLGFVLFAVPVGEELIPFLQEITADLSVFLLELTGIPLFRSGLFIEIPQGKFLVAEACSGVSFLIASIVLGSLYANMNLISWQRRTFFVILSILFPIAANAVRVYGIIYIGYASDMEHAVGADHLIYGWFFFAFVLVCLFLIGEVIRRNELKKNKAIAVDNEQQDSSEQKLKATLPDNLKVTFSMFIVVIALMALTQVQASRMDIVIPESEANISLPNLGLEMLQEERHSHRLAWVPRYVGNNAEKLAHVDHMGEEVDLYIAYFDGSDGELVSSLHRLYEQDRWTLVKRSKMSLNSHEVQRELITSSIGVKKQILYWYVVNGSIVNSYKQVKIFQLLQTLKGQATNAYVVAVAIDIEQNEEELRPELESFASLILKELSIQQTMMEE